MGDRPTARPPLIGKHLGIYRLGPLLGSGGMGEVYRAQDTRLGRDVAIKILPSAFTADQDRAARFDREARVLAALNHPHIASIYGVEESEGVQALVLELVEGPTLAERLANGPMPMHEAVSIACQIAEALEAAHEKGIVHRDLKPANIKLTADGNVKVLDFGLAKALVGEKRTGELAEAPTVTAAGTRAGLMLGTPGYMSPEQTRGGRVDKRTDIWAFGCVLYELLTGRRAFGGGTVSDTIAAVLEHEPDWQALPAATPDHIRQLLRRCVEKDPKRRLRDIGDAATDLTPDAGTAHRHMGAGRGFVSRQPAKGVILAALAAIGVVGLIYTWRFAQAAAFGQRAIRSVAVLPLANVNADADTDYLSDGITDTIIDRLSRLPDLKVMAHTAVFHYKEGDTDARTVGRALGVEAVLTGRLVKRGDALTITLELADARDNSHVWGARYDRSLADLLAVQREIPVDVSDQLRLRLSRESKDRLSRPSTANTDAYQLYLKGRYAWEKWTRDGARQSLEFLEEAIRKDPNYALAYSGLAEVLLNFGSGVGPQVPQREAHRRAREAATKALSIDPQLGEAHAALAEVLLYDDWNFAGTERELKQAIELNPSYPEGHHEYSHLLLLLGRAEESLAESNKLLDVDPISETPIGHLAYHYLATRQYDLAIQQLKKDLQLYPDAADHGQLGDAYYAKGMFREATGEYLKNLPNQGLDADSIADVRHAVAGSGIKGYFQKRLEQLTNPRDYVPETNDFQIAVLSARLHPSAHALEWLEKAYREHADMMVRLNEEAAFDTLRADSRFADLVRRVGLPQGR